MVISFVFRSSNYLYQSIILSFELNNKFNKNPKVLILFYYASNCTTRYFITIYWYILFRYLYKQLLMLLVDKLVIYYVFFNILTCDFFYGPYVWDGRNKILKYYLVFVFCSEMNTLQLWIHFMTLPLLLNY